MTNAERGASEVGSRKSEVGTRSAELKERGTGAEQILNAKGKAELRTSAFRVPPSDAPRSRLWHWALPLLAAVVVLGGVATWQTARMTDREMRARLLTEGRMIAQAVNADRILTLNGTEADLTHPEYHRLKQQLTRIRSVNPACRFIYLMGQRPDKSIFFFVDSEPPESEDYSYPGQLYGEISPASLRVFTTRQPATVGPAADRWGTWVSAVAPITAPETDALIAVLGMDVDARAWNRAIAFHCVAPVSVTALILLILASVVRVRHRDLLEKLRLTASEAEYRTLFDASRDANMLCDRKGFFNCNQATLQMFGCPSRDEFVSKHPADWSPPTQPDGQNSRAAAGQRIDTAFVTGGVSFEWTHQRTDGKPFPAEVLLSRIEYHGKAVLLATVRDITERLTMERALRQQHTLTSIGTLASGMAHEINNPLNGIMNYAELIRGRAADNAPLIGFADEILAEGRRMARMTQSLLSFTQQAEPRAMTLASVADVVGPMVATAEASARERGIVLACELAADLPPVSCHKSQIGKVVAALLANAVEAFEEAPAEDRRLQSRGGEKRIVVSVREIVVSDQSSVVSVDTDHSSSCRRLRLTVADNGPGIPTAIRERVFDPFFTTKDRTQHSGLGLWISRSIIREHGGELRMESPSTALRAGEEGKGTRVHVELPAHSNSERGTRSAERREQ